MLIFIEALPFARYHAKNVSCIISVINFFQKSICWTPAMCTTLFVALGIAPCTRQSP